jgi:hypothetical protein
VTSCEFTATLAGTVDFVVSAATSGHVAPENANVINAKTYTYYAQSFDSLGNVTAWEAGSGPYTISTHTLQRLKIVANSDGTLIPVSFPLPPIVDVYESSSNSLESAPFASGTRISFQQSTAPTGWTKDTTFNDCSLRIVSGTASSGGSNAFSTVNAQTAVGGHTLVDTEMSPDTMLWAPPSGDQYALSGVRGLASVFNSSATQPHSHSIIMNVKFVDFILASKN